MASSHHDSTGSKEAVMHLLHNITQDNMHKRHSSIKMEIRQIQKQVKTETILSLLSRLETYYYFIIKLCDKTTKGIHTIACHHINSRYSSCLSLVFFKNKICFTVYLLPKLLIQVNVLSHTLIFDHRGMVMIPVEIRAIHHVSSALVCDLYIYTVKNFRLL